MPSVVSNNETKFETILHDLRAGGDASVIADCLDELRDPEYAEPISRYLATKFGDEPKVTRVLIRAAGELDYRPVHDILAATLLAGPEKSKYTFEILDALGKTEQSDYAGVLLQYLGDRHGFDIQSTAVYSLGLLGSPLAIPHLLDLRKRGRLRDLAAESLRRILLGQMSARPFDLYLA
jgi:HEAT repeat protein